MLLTALGIGSDFHDSVPSAAFLMKWVSFKFPYLPTFSPASYTPQIFRLHSILSNPLAQYQPVSLYSATLP